MIEYLGDDHFLYASDVPHWDGEFPKNTCKDSLKLRIVAG